MVATIENEFLRLSVKGSGAEIVSLKGVSDETEYIWQGDPAFWPRRAPVLFPIVGRLNGHKLRVESKEYVLPQHGFARNQMFDLIGGNKNKLVFQLKSNEDTLKQFPFHFELTVAYRLEGKSVSICYEVKNTDNKTIYFSIGGHPGFNVQLFPGEEFSDYFLEFEKNENVIRHLLADGLFTGETEQVVSDSSILNLSHNLFQKDALVLKNLNSDHVFLKSKKSKYCMKFSFSDFPYLGIWSPKGNAPFVCIEPWFGLADKAGYTGEFKDKEGTQALETDKTFTCTFSFELINL